MQTSKALSKALEHYELATTHLAIALHLFTEHTLHVETHEQEHSVVFLGMACASFLSEVQPVLKQLCDAGLYRMPQEALELLANTDPRSFLAAATVRRDAN